MPTEILIKSATPIVWADVTDYAGDLGTRTDQIDLTSLATVSARQGDKKDLGAVRAALYSVTLGIEAQVAPVSGAIVSLWWAPSPAAGAAVANPGGIVGADGPYTGTASDALADAILQLTLIGNLVVTSDGPAITQFETFIFAPEHRYGTPVVYNETLQSLNTTDAIEMGIAFTPIIDEAQ